MCGSWRRSPRAGPRGLGAVDRPGPAAVVARALGERSASADVNRVGEDSVLTVRFNPFTRRELLDVFPPNPTVDDVLRGPHSKRAQSYWREAIAQLRRAKAVGYYRELEPLSLTRKGWADPGRIAWFHGDKCSD